jgi:hypothetical protein
VAIVSTRTLRIRPAARPGSSPLTLQDLPAFIALPRDSEGRPIIPKSRATALVEAQQAWHQELGALDTTSSSIVKDLLVMPKISSPSQRKILRNHPSWEDDPAAQAALGPIIAKWLAQGVFETLNTSSGMIGSRSFSNHAAPCPRARPLFTGSSQTPGSETPCTLIGV